MTVSGASAAPVAETGALTLEELANAVILATLADRAPLANVKPTGARMGDLLLRVVWERVHGACAIYAPGERARIVEMMTELAGAVLGNRTPPQSIVAALRERG